MNPNDWTFYAEHRSKTGALLARVKGEKGVHTREQVAEQLFREVPTAKGCTTGRGNGGAYFDLRWIRRVVQ